MLRNYLKVAVRTITRQKGYSFINIAGLALGMSCAILILLWVQDEVSYDRFHANASSLFRVEEDQHYSGELFHVLVTPYPAAPAFKEEIPEIVDATRYSWGFSLLIRHAEKAFYETEIRAVDSAFLRMFSFPLLRGETATALDDPFSVVITKTMADKYFPDEEALGKVLSANNKYDFVVTGVLDDVPENSSLQFDMLVPFEFTKEMGWYNEHWGSNSIQTFVQLRAQSVIESVNDKMTGLLRSHNEDSVTDFVLAPLTGIHLHQYAGYGHQAGNIQYVYIFTVVALFVLLLACINFMNLSTARSANRAKEIGMRKVTGARRANIAGQFLGESGVIAFAALFVAVILVLLLLPAFNTLSGKQIEASVLATPAAIVGLVAVTLVTALVAGSYPAFFLSRFQPVMVLKGNLKSGAKSSSMRRVLVVTQFALSVSLLIGTGIVYKQLEFMRSKALGYDKEHLLYIRMRGNSSDAYDALKRELLNQPGVLGVTASGQRPARIGSNSSGAEWQGKDPESEILISHDRVGYDYVETLKIKMAAGRSFSREYPSDAGTDSTGAFLINERLAGIMGLAPIVGADFSFMGKKGKIVGVMQDFHFQSVRVAIEPFAIILANPQKLRFLTIRILPGDIPASIEKIKEVWRTVIPQYPFDFKFVDEELDTMYRAEERLSGVLKYFAALAVIISCLGLFGLASFVAAQRTKEVGIRKVLGASVAGIVLLLSKEFSRWVVLANVVAWPLAYYAMTGWLQKFAYRVELSWGLFLAAGMLALGIALLTVSSLAIKSAVTNPVKALRYE